MKPLCVFGSIAFKEFSINFNRLWEEVGNLSNISFLILIVLFRHFIKKALNSNILFTQRDKYYFSDAFSVGSPVTWLKRNFRLKVQIIGSVRVYILHAIQSAHSAGREERPEKSENKNFINLRDQRKLILWKGECLWN